MHYINYLLDYINSIPADSWYALGGLIASALTVIGAVGWIKRRHLKKHAEKAGKLLITANVAFWSFVTTVLSFVILNGETFAVFIPYLAERWPQIIGVATVIYNVAVPSLKWWQERKAGKAVQAANIQAAAAAIPAITIPEELTPAAAAPAETGEPSADLFR